MLLQTISEILAANNGAATAAPTVESIAATRQMIATVYTEGESITGVLIRSADDCQTHFLNGVVMNPMGQLQCFPPKRLVRLTPEEYLSLVPTQVVTASNEFVFMHDSVLNDELDPADRVKIDKAESVRRNRECASLLTTEIIEAANGTVVTIYHDGAQWCLSTGRSIDASNVILTGGMSMMDIFTEQLASSGLSMEDLAPECSYTFVICHPAYHVLPIFDLSVVSIWDRKTRQYLEFDGAKSDVRAERFADLRQWTRHLTSVEIYTRCTESISAVIEGRYEGAFGYIIRDADQSRPDYYVESDVMRFLRENIYSCYRAGAGMIDPKYRTIRILVHVYLASQANSKLFHALFASQYAEELVELEAIFTAIRRDYETYCQRHGGNLDRRMPEEFYVLAAAARKQGRAPERLFDLSLINEIFALVKRHLA